jgi:hypothetical protein
MDDKREVANSGEEQSCLARMLSDENEEERRRGLRKSGRAFEGPKIQKRRCKQATRVGTVLPRWKAPGECLSSHFLPAESPLQSRNALEWPKNWPTGKNQQEILNSEPMGEEVLRASGVKNWCWEQLCIAPARSLMAQPFRAAINVGSPSLEGVQSIAYRWKRMVCFDSVRSVQCEESCRRTLYDTCEQR